MFCENIAVAVPHHVGSSTRKDTFFVVRVPLLEAQNLVNQIGEAYVDAHSIQNFLNWQGGQTPGDLFVLASLNLRYLVMTTDLHHILPNDAKLVPLGDEGEIQARDLGELKSPLEKLVAERPWLVQELRMKPPKIKTRTNFSDSVIYEFDPFAMAQNGLAQPEYADLSCLAWAYPIARGYSNIDAEFEYWFFEKNVEKRLVNQINLSDPHYDTECLTLDELNRRAESSWKTYFSIRDEWQEILGEPSAKQFKSWAKRIRDIDDAISLAVIAQFEYRLQNRNELTERLSSFLLEIAFQKIESQSAQASFDPNDF